MEKVSPRVSKYCIEGSEHIPSLPQFFFFFTSALPQLSIYVLDFLELHRYLNIILGEQTNCLPHKQQQQILNPKTN
jgi:hypothetical protein